MLTMRGSESTSRRADNGRVGETGTQDGASTIPHHMRDLLEKANSEDDPDMGHAERLKSQGSFGQDLITKPQNSSDAPASLSPTRSLSGHIDHVHRDHNPMIAELPHLSFVAGAIEPAVVG